MTMKKTAIRRRREELKLRREAERAAHRVAQAALVAERRARRGDGRTTRGVSAGAVGWVYLVRNTVTRNVKIGFTKQPVAQRLRKLQQGNDARLELIGSLPALGREERALHIACEAQRLGGEWFAPNGEVLRAISYFVLGGRLGKGE